MQTSFWTRYGLWLWFTQSRNFLIEGLACGCLFVWVPRCMRVLLASCLGVRVKGKH
jgi:hypothetical protein